MQTVLRLQFCFDLNLAGERAAERGGNGRHFKNAPTEFAPRERRVQRERDNGEADDRGNQCDERNGIAFMQLLRHDGEANHGGNGTPKSGENPEQQDGFARRRSDPATRPIFSFEPGLVRVSFRDAEFQRLFFRADPKNERDESAANDGHAQKARRHLFFHSESADNFIVQNQDEREKAYDGKRQRQKDGPITDSFRVHRFTVCVFENEAHILSPSSRNPHGLAQKAENFSFPPALATRASLARKPNF
ncbi:MAG: hypothetical protein KGJ60_08965 [Verrucomicrobiota bacterium]|nr:hypothetical protein [Verrucomicrobiota bacterium]